MPLFFKVMKYWLVKYALKVLKEVGAKPNAVLEVIARWF